MESSSIMLHQLVSQTPIILAGIIGIVWAGKNMKRFRMPSFLTLLGAAILVISTFVIVIAQSHSLSDQSQKSTEVAATSSELMSPVALVSSLVRGVAIVLLIWAIFVGRKKSIPESPTPTP